MSQVIHRIPSNTNSKLLYIMGATWKNKSMFDLDYEEDSFCDMLVNNGIETFTFDIPQTCHEDVLSISSEIIHNNNIKNIFAYSYGCLPAIELSLKFNIDNIILLDPYCNIPINRVETNNEFWYSTKDVELVIDEYSIMNEQTKSQYLKSLGDSFKSPTYPKKQCVSSCDYYADLLNKVKSNILIAFTNSANDFIKNKFCKFNHKVYDSSHWILLEEERKTLCTDVYTMLNRTCL